MSFRGQAGLRLSKRWYVSRGGGCQRASRQVTREKRGVERSDKKTEKKINSGKKKVADGKLEIKGEGEGEREKGTEACNRKKG